MRATTATMVLMLALGFAPAAGAQDHAHHDGAVGVNVEDLVAIAKAMNPDLQVGALEAEAAAARVEGAGTFADPKVQIVYEDWGKNTGGGDFPNNSTSGVTKRFRVFQELPFWGKRDLRREIAQAGARRAIVLKKQVENDLVAKVKVAYAEYHQAHLVIDLARDLKARLGTLSKLAGVRYAQALGRQQDVTRAEVERSALDAEIVRMQGERAKARARINRLLARPVQAPLVEAPAPRALPPMETLELDALVERAKSANPDILAAQATIDGADKSVSLAERNWFPDVEVGIGAVRIQGDIQSYEAMLTSSVPLQWGLRNAEIGESKAMAAAARLKREARANELGNEVADAWIALKNAREVETLLSERQLPQAEIGFQTAAKSYELGRSDFLDVLMTEQQLWKSHIELIKVRFEQQIRMAELEKLVGGEL
jgi:outer membrane protein TolC